MKISRLLPSVKRLYAALLVITLVFQGAAGLASAEDTITGIYLDSVPSPIQLYVDDGTVSLTLWASVQGASTPRNVTADAAWSSSSSSVKVDKGVLSASGSISSATITAKYKTFTATATVKADYRYASVKLKNSNGTDAPEQWDIELGNSLSYQAFAYEDDGTEVAATGTAQWLTSNSNVATVSGGAVTLVGPGTVTITAKLKGRSDTIQLNVTSPYKSLDLAHAQADDAVELNVGDGDYTLTAMATLKNGSTPTLNVTSDATWTTSNANVVKVEGGVVTPVAAGTAVVTAKRYGVSDAVTFYVRTPYEAMTVTTEKPLNMTLYGASVEVSTTVMKGSEPPLDKTDEAVWKIADPSVAAIEKSGGKVYVKPKGVGTTKLTVSYKGLSKELPVSVFSSINKVNIVDDKLDVFETETGAMPAVKGTTVGGDEIDLAKLAVWKSSDESTLSIKDGKWTAHKVGTVTLTAEIENEPSAAKKSDTILVKVHKNVLTLLTDSSNVSVVIGKETDLPSVKLVYTDGEEKDVSKEVEWKSSSPNLFVKSDKMKGLLASSVTLTGTYLNKKVTVKVQVEEEFVSFDIQPKTLSLTINKSQSVKVTGITKSGKKVTLGSRMTWKSNSEQLVKITGASIKGLEEGSGKLTAAVQGKTLELAYTVKAKLTKLSPSDTSLKLSAGQTNAIHLTAMYENGKSLDATQTAVWTSSKSQVATVSKGVIKANGKGSASIKAVFEGKTVTIRVTVK